jgi:hypothetical protein
MLRHLAALREAIADEVEWWHRYKYGRRFPTRPAPIVRATGPRPAGIRRGGFIASYRSHLRGEWYDCEQCRKEREAHIERELGRRL